MAVTLRFTGKSLHTLDAKARLIVPVRFRSLVPETPQRGGFYLARGAEQCIYLYTQEGWEDVVKKVEQAFPNETQRRFNRFFFSDMTFCACDPQWRLTVPTELKEHAKIDRDIMLVGAGSWGEIWDVNFWKQHCDEYSPQYADYVNKLWPQITPTPLGARPGTGGLGPTT